MLWADIEVEVPRIGRLRAMESRLHRLKAEFKPSPFHMRDGQDATTYRVALAMDLSCWSTDFSRPKLLNRALSRLKSLLQPRCGAEIAIRLSQLGWEWRRDIPPPTGLPDY